MSDRKYRHRGYHDSDRSESQGGSRPQGPRQERPERIEGAPRGRSAGGFGPQAFKCSVCGEKQRTFEEVVNEAACARCNADLHTCTNCVSFDTSAHWQCRAWEHVPARVSPKDARNACAAFAPRLVADLAADKGRIETPDDARKAFDALFKK